VSTDPAITNVGLPRAAPLDKLLEVAAISNAFSTLFAASELLDDNKADSRERSCSMTERTKSDL
jgi:hypothetical protein